MLKSILLSISLAAASTSAFASPSSQVIATVMNVNDKIQAVSLTEGGKLQVILRERHAEISKQLSKATTQRLSFEASLLANAPLTTTHHVIVCMMLINPMFMTSLAVAPYSENTGVFEDGALKTVLTPSSCALSSATFPTDRDAFAAATSLKDTLVTLGTEAFAKAVQE